MPAGWSVAPFSAAQAGYIGRRRAALAPPGTTSVAAAASPPLAPDLTTPTQNRRRLTAGLNSDYLAPSG